MACAEDNSRRPLGRGAVALSLVFVLSILASAAALDSLVHFREFGSWMDAKWAEINETGGTKNEVKI